MQVLGALKVGELQLFVYSTRWGQLPCKPHCILDFCVHKSFQRLGIGRALLEVSLSGLPIALRQMTMDETSSSPIELA